jgi:thioredoxin reductase (NADPH)
LLRSGIRLSDDELRQPEYDAETMESNMRNVFLAGVVCGGMNTHVWFIEKCEMFSWLVLFAAA